MTLINPKAVFFFLTGLVFLLNSSTNFASAADNINLVNDNSTGWKGYTDVTKYKDGFLAAGSDGRIDKISTSGKIIQSEKIPGAELNCILVVDQQIIAAGAKGKIFIISGNWKVNEINSESDNNINSLTFFKGMVIAGTDNGEILILKNDGLFKKINLNLKGNIVSVSSEKSRSFGVTDEGEIINTTDGINWNIIDFNNFYSGYYKPCKFTTVLVTENQIAVAGKQDDGAPVMYLSTRGKVWAERSLNYTDEHGNMSFLSEIPYDMFYDLAIDQFVLVCSKGKLMTIPSCSHCNALMELPTQNDLKSITANGQKIMIVGENFYVNPVNSD